MQKELLLPVKVSRVETTRRVKTPVRCFWVVKFCHWSRKKLEVLSGEAEAIALVRKALGNIDADKAGLLTHRMLIRVHVRLS